MVTPDSRFSCDSVPCVPHPTPHTGPCCTPMAVGSVLLLLLGQCFLLVHPSVVIQYEPTLLQHPAQADAPTIGYKDFKFCGSDGVLATLKPLQPVHCRRLCSHAYPGHVLRLRETERCAKGLQRVAAAIPGLCAAWRTAVRGNLWVGFGAVLGLSVVGG